ncbi:hypothetical protein ASC96_26540 [Rhizobium sp. Root1204]|nr:hypothetical protein ASC96_26540 [Rhizobium sp. Root1204]
MLLLRGREALLAEYRPIFRGRNLTEQQWRILRFLELISPLDATSLSEKSMILPPSLTRIMRDLEARGLLSRTDNRSGPSRVLLSITEEGRELVKNMAPKIADGLAQAQSKLNRTEQRQLLALLEKLARD